MNAWGFMTILAGLAFLISWLYSCVAFDRLVQMEHDDHPKAWEEDGHPIGFFYRPSGAAWLPSRPARWRIVFGWPVSPPAWARESAAARKAMRRLRTGIATMYACLAIASVSLEMSGW